MEYSDKIIQAFTKYERISDISRETGLSRNTVVKYKKDPKLQQQVKEQRANLIMAAVALMQDYLAEAVNKLIQIIENPDTTAQVKINGLQLLFNQCRDWTTTADLQERIANLERNQDNTIDHF